MKEKLSQKPSTSRFSFISHMVQMKDVQSSYAFVFLPALYPTWFRWKLLRARKQSRKGVLYIPHGSDESYRCWQFMFRHYLLYIPHGSDESSEGVAQGFSGISFISHMVQMKAWLCHFASYQVNPFISHMVQMKGYLWFFASIPV